MFVLRRVGGVAARVVRRLLPIHDVSTAYDAQHLPMFIHDHRRGRPQLVGALRLLYGDVRPVVVDSGDTAAVFDAALEAAHAMGLQVVAEEAPNRFQALAVTRVMRFKDDVVVTVTPGEAGGTLRVDTRSRSRVGQGDVGANGARVLAFQARLRRALAARGIGVAAGPAPRP